MVYDMAPHPPGHKPPLTAPALVDDRIEFSSCPGMTREQWERVEEERCWSLSGDEDILVLGRDVHEHQMTVSIKRSDLCRFPLFERFFRSDHYTPHMGTQLWLLNDDRHVDMLETVMDCTRNPSLIYQTLQDLEELDITERVDRAARLYKAALRLEAPRLISALTIWLLNFEPELGPVEVRLIAIAAYSRPEPNALRDWLRAIIPARLRQLFLDPYFRQALWTIPLLASDLCDWMATALLTGDWPQDRSWTRIDLPPPPTHPLLQPHERLCGTVIWTLEGGSLQRGDRLVDCQVTDGTVQGWTSIGMLAEIHRDGIHLTVEPRPGTLPSTMTPTMAFFGMVQDGGDPNLAGTSAVTTTSAMSPTVINSPSSTGATGNRDKASRILGIDDIMTAGVAAANGTLTMEPTQTPKRTTKRVKLVGKSISLTKSQPSASPLALTSTSTGTENVADAGILMAFVGDRLNAPGPEGGSEGESGEVRQRRWSGL